ncbi:hypothetical protein DVU_1155 [Nitratidesulfovibrio vulgaris str. Hildenborough]|uniref:Uncharacterized protein n=1 Tax=Nitratidesulfovibrio vulgaris (strain ATCC 29579 / DSM 644 / CCUG 34227 / NCIMB 8303 / VKM B-1760 / Hildenborough) TaxID=882 RepID=Q72CX8_NITV2|nr:hypothetical protein DVU_1155 [Nitratidesulfovibrio vulgaris str. Hildenborough]
MSHSFYMAIAVDIHDHVPSLHKQHMHDICCLRTT